MDAVLASWAESASFWARHHGTLSAMFAPISDAMMEAAALGPHDSVLDVAGGTGEPAMTFARRVREVVHTDAVPEMVEHAKRFVLDRQIDTVRCQVAAAEQLPFEDDVFDCVTSRLGLMFFPRPDLALLEMARVSRGRVCVATWDSRTRNPFFDVPLRSVQRYVDTAADPLTSRGLRFEDPASVVALFEAAGLKDVRARRVPFVMHGVLDFDRWWHVRVELSSTLRHATASLDEEQRAALRADVEQGMRPYMRADGFAVPASTIVVVGHV